MKTFVTFVMGIALAGLLCAGCGDDDGTQCTPNDHLECTGGTVYQMDSCNNQGLVEEVCDCGCDAAGTGCETPCVCTPDCAGRECGDDGCLGSCGTCNTGQTCTAAGQCEGCEPDCAGKECGDDGCGDVCGTCAPLETCDATGQCVVYVNELEINSCDVPFVLDAAQLTNTQYLTQHFTHLIQQYCITGTFDGSDIAAYPEKMYYGQHDNTDILSLVQFSMDNNPQLHAVWSVRVDFEPDTAVTTGATWYVGVSGSPIPEARVGLIWHIDENNTCLEAVGTNGTIEVVDASDVTLQEGGTFIVNGHVDLSDVHSITDYCNQTTPNLPCCPP